MEKHEKSGGGGGGGGAGGDGEGKTVLAVTSLESVFILLRGNCDYSKCPKFSYT